MRYPDLLARRLLTLLFGLLPCGLTAAAGSTAALPLESGGLFAVPVQSIRELRFRHTVRQQYDYSCGSAALATLLTYHYDTPVSEQEVFRAMFARGDREKIRRDGFSLLDIKRYLAERGFVADGYETDLSELTQAGVPAIALIKERGYHHFVVIKGIRGERVLVGDPSSGTRVVPIQQFRQVWVNRVLFVIRNRTERVGFNRDADWRWAPRAPIADALYRQATDVTLPKRGPADF